MEKLGLRTTTELIRFGVAPGFDQDRLIAASARVRLLTNRYFYSLMTTEFFLLNEV